MTSAAMDVVSCDQCNGAGVVPGPQLIQRVYSGRIASHWAVVPRHKGRGVGTYVYCKCKSADALRKLHCLDVPKRASVEVTSCLAGRDASVTAAPLQADVETDAGAVEAFSDSSLARFSSEGRAAAGENASGIGLRGRQGQVEVALPQELQHDPCKRRGVCRVAVVCSEPDPGSRIGRNSPVPTGTLAKTRGAGQMPRGPKCFSAAGDVCDVTTLRDVRGGTPLNAGDGVGDGTRIRTGDETRRQGRTPAG